MDKIRSKLYMNLIELKSSLEMYYWSVTFNNIVSNAEKKLSTQFDVYSFEPLSIIIGN